MAGLFDDLIPASSAPAAAAPAPASAVPQGSGGLFDDLIPTQPATAAPLTIKGSPQSAGDALDMVEGTGTDAYNTGPSENGATVGQRAATLAGNVNNFVRATANAVPLVGGLADKLDAATSAALGGSYAGSLAQQQAQDQQFAQQNPVAAGTAGLLGAGAGTAAMLPDAALGLVGSTAARVGGGAAGGALLGGADSAIRGDSPVTGAAVGALGGAAGPAIGAGAGAAYRLGANLVPQAVPEALQGYSRTARGWLQRGIGDATPQEMQAAAAALGDQGFFGERSPGLLDLTQSVANNTGPGKAIVRDAFDARNAGTGQRVMGAVDEALGPAQNPTPVKQAIQDAQSAVTTPYFAQAFQNGAPYTPDLAALVQRPAIASAMQDAAEAAADRGVPLGTITLDASGNPVASGAAMQAYEAGQRPAVTGALANMLGADPTMGPLATQSALTIQRKAASDPLYDAYRQMSVPMTPELAGVLNRPSTRAALAQAERKAQDEGTTIFAPRARQFETDPLGSGNVPEPPIDLDNIPPFQAEQAPSRPEPVGVPRPQDLHAFVRSAGGIQDRGGDLASMGYGNLVARPGEGLGADAMRQAAAQAGYLGPNIDHATANTTVNDLFNAIGSDNPIHSVFDQDAAAQWAARDAAMADYNRGGAARGEVGRDAGPRPMAPGLPFGGPDVPTGPAARAPQITPRGLDLVKRALQDKADTAGRAGSTDDARIFGNLKNELLAAIENHPDPSIADAYGAARRAYAGPSREIDALNAGRVAFGDNVTPEQVQREYAALQTDGERQRYRQGMFSAGSDKLSKAGDTSNFVRTVAGNQTLRDKFAAVAPHQEALDTFNGHIARAQQQFTEAQRPTSEALHHALGVLDARVARGETAVTPARDALAAHLGRDPYYAYGRAQDQSYGALLGAMDQGKTALRTGSNAINPADFADRFGSRTGAGQEAERVAMRADLDSQLRQSRNDYGTMNRLLQGEDGYNSAKIGTAFGEDNRAQLTAALLREDAMKANKKAVMDGSPTGERTAVRELTQPDVKTGFLGYLANMRPLDQPATILPPFLHPQNLGERFYAGRYEAARKEIAPLLVSRDGAQIDALMAALLRMQAGRAAVPAVNADALVKVLAGVNQRGRQLVEQ